MPAGNRTGPTGMGPKSGRGMGHCAGFNSPGNVNPGTGYWGFGRGASGGHGYRNWFHATGQPGWLRSNFMGGAYPPVPNRMTEEEEQEILRDQEKWLEDQLNDVRSRIKKGEEK